MIGVPIEDAIGKTISEVIPSSNSHVSLIQVRSELNKELVLGNGLKIVTSRYPLFDYKGVKVGAFAVFKDMTEVVALAEEITDLEQSENDA